jgi:hypothetical protein
VASNGRPCLQQAAAEKLLGTRGVCWSQKPWDSWALGAACVVGNWKRAGIWCEGRRSHLGLQFVGVSSDVCGGCVGLRSVRRGASSAALLPAVMPHRSNAGVLVLWSQRAGEGCLLQGTRTAAGPAPCRRSLRWASGSLRCRGLCSSAERQNVCQKELSDSWGHECSNDMDVRCSAAMAAIL